MKEYVLDANALVRLFRNAPGAETVDDLVRQAKSGRAHLSISVVNLTEVLYVLAHYFGQEKALFCVDKARRVADSVSVDEQIAIDTGILHIRYKLGLADGFAAELAMRTGATLVSADPEFAKLGKQLKILALPRHKK
ncbi:MAG: PIN domain-containing protein [Terracidiphilus sp.]